MADERAEQRRLHRDALHLQEEVSRLQADLWDHDPADERLLARIRAIAAGGEDSLDPHQVMAVSRSGRPGKPARALLVLLADRAGALELDAQRMSRIVQRQATAHLDVPSLLDQPGQRR
jgi:hypothetical protein